MSDYNSMEKRRCFRFPVNCPVAYSSIDFKHQDVGVVIDISAEGMGFLSPELLNPETILSLRVDIHDKGEPFITRAKVIWSNKLPDGKYRLGARFERPELLGVSRVLVSCRYGASGEIPMKSNFSFRRMLRDTFFHAQARTDRVRFKLEKVDK